MRTSDSKEEKSEAARSSRAMTEAPNHKKRITNILIILGAVTAVGLFILFSYWHPLWRYQSGYVSEVQFGADWPFTVPEARVLCLGSGEMVLQTRAGVFGLTSHAIAIGYDSLDESKIWKWDPGSWHNRVPAERFWTYVNTLCK